MFAKQFDVWRDFLCAMAESWKKLKTSNLFSSSIVSSNRNRSALVRELLCNNLLFVGQLYEDKSLALRARDLIFFTTDLQTVNYYTTFLNIIHAYNYEISTCLLEPICQPSIMVFDQAMYIIFGLEF